MRQILFLGLLILVSFGPEPSFAADPTHSVAVTNDLRALLEIQKLRAEIARIRLENANLSSPWSVFSTNAALITAMVALAGVFITIWKHMTEMTRRDQQAREEKEKERQQRNDDINRSAFERFNQSVERLGSRDQVLRASAIISLLAHLNSQDYKRQVFLILQASVRLRHSKELTPLLVSGFERAARQCNPESNPTHTHPSGLSANMANREDPLNLSRARLKRVNLSKLDLHGVDIAFAEMAFSNLVRANMARATGWKVNLENAHLSRANLQEARLKRCKLRSAILHDCNLVSANLKEADLRGVQFQRSKLQSAHLDGANLQGARFEEADLNDAFFLRSKFSSGALKSIVGARNWRKAHFDDSVRQQLESLTQNGG